MRGNVVGQLSVTIDEHRAQQVRSQWGIDPICDSRAGLADCSEFMAVPPAKNTFDRKGGEPIRGNLVNESMRRPVTVRVVLRDPGQSARECKNGLAVLQRFTFIDDACGLPRRREPGERAWHGVPGENLLDRRRDDA
jgi:hypothetical protein